MHKIEIAPTIERAKHSLGIRNTGKRFSVIPPIEFLYERNALGLKGTTEAVERLETGKYFTFLWVLAEERPNRAAMLDWTRFLGGGGSSVPANSAENYEAWLLDKKREYINLRRDIITHGYFGKSGHDMLMMLCGSGLKLGQIEAKKGFVEGMAGNILRRVLDDLKKLIA